MKIIVDTREQLPYQFARWAEVQTVAGTLAVGDYAVQGLEHHAAIERKSLSDLIGSLSQGRDRFERELARGAALRRFWLVIEATAEDVARHRYKSKMNPVAVLQSLAAFEVRYGTRFVWAGSREGGEYWTYSLLQKYRRQLLMDLEACIEIAPPARKVDHATIV